MESENEIFNRLYKECEKAYAVVKIAQNKYYNFVKDIYKYKINIYNSDNDGHKETYYKFLDMLSKSKTFGEYFFNDLDNYAKGFWIPDIDFSDYKRFNFEFKDSKTNKLKFVFCILESGDFIIETSRGDSDCYLRKEEFEKLKLHDKRDEIFQLIINGYSELALILLNNE